MTYEQARARAEVLKALAHPVRLILVEALRSGERCACELQELVDVDQSTLSRHLSQLKGVGILAERREGVRRILRLAAPWVLEAVACAERIAKNGLRRRARALSD